MIREKYIYLKRIKINNNNLNEILISHQSELSKLDTKYQSILREIYSRDKHIEETIIQ